MEFSEYDLPYESFIGGWFIPTEICDGLIECYNDTKEISKKQGVIGNGIIHKETKDSMDLTLYDNTSNEAFSKYKNVLMQVSTNYFNKYPYSVPSSRIGFREGHNIQLYPTCGGYKEYHCERNVVDPVNLCRHLAYMTYLNTIDTDGGETEFFYQKIKVKPEKGLTLIWPSDWTHTHRGIPATQEEKMIITGWIHYAN